MISSPEQLQSLDQMSTVTIPGERAITGEEYEAERSALLGGAIPWEEYMRSLPSPAIREELSWMALALCPEIGPIFHPQKGEVGTSAKLACGLCDVESECLTDVLQHDEEFGIWGGKSVRERRQLKKRAG